MTVTLTNTTNRMKAYNLPHDVYCAALGSCACTISKDRSRRLIPSSLTIPSGGVTEKLPDAVLSVSEISVAVKKRDLLVKREAKRREKKEPSARKTRRRKKKSKDSSGVTAD
ncbi:MAG: hypothetical protein GY854_25165 [Deltaproteobacteria bacterium]|nr:hypothetical protein [Deltaproteobacteria bacterium]